MSEPVFWRLKSDEELAWEEFAKMAQRHISKCFGLPEFLVRIIPVTVKKD